MAVAFASASSQRLTDSAAYITAYPYTVAFWFNVPADSTEPVLWSLTDSAANQNQWYIQKSTTNTVYFGSQEAGVFASVQTTGTIGGNAWNFVLFRAISSTNRRGSVLFSNGSIEHVQSTSGSTPGGIDSIAIGCAYFAPANFFTNGRIAEYWITNADIQADGAALFDSTLRQIAYNGPFPMMHLMGSYFHYRSFRRGLASDQDGLGEVFTKGAPNPTLVNVNGATLGAHVPLPRSYVRPDLAMTRAILV